MTGLPAARKTDDVRHKGADGDILEGSPNVFIGPGGLPAARMGDRVRHGDSIEVITEGEPTVTINGLPAARITDGVSCGGYIVTGCGTVRIGKTIGQAAPGGKPGNQTSNNAQAGMKMCQAAIKGRNLNTPNRLSRNLISTQQSYSNCDIESARQIINQATDKNLTEDGLLQWALDNNLAMRGNPNVPAGTPPAYEDGGTNYTGIQAILDHYHIPSTVEASNLSNIGQALASGKGVIATVSARALWNDTRISADIGHAVTITGIEYDDNGNATNVIINDTGRGDCGREVPVNTWNNAVNTYNTPDHPALLNVTNKSIF